MQKKSKKDEKKFCQFGKRSYFCIPVLREKMCGWYGQRSLRKQRPKAACPAGGRLKVARSGRNEKGKEDNSEEILTMKSLILAQDER